MATAANSIGRLGSFAKTEIHRASGRFQMDELELDGSQRPEASH